MRAFGYYWLNFRFWLEHIQEEYGFFIAFWLCIIGFALLSTIQEGIWG